MLDPSQLVPERMRPLRRTEYERLVEAGCFEDERVELLCGVLVEMSPQGGRHSRVVAQLHTVEIVPVSRSNKHPRRAFLLIEVATPRCARTVTSRRRSTRRRACRSTGSSISRAVVRTRRGTLRPVALPITIAVADLF